MSIVASIIKIGTRLIGITEKKGNTGWTNAQFEKDMRIIGWYVGAAWCAFVAKYIFLEAYCTNAKITKVIKNCFTGGALDTWHRVVKDGTFKTGTTPKPGAIVIWQHGSTTKGHVGIVESVDFKTNTMQTLEGNTNAAGSREGNCFAKKPRTIERPFRADGLNVVGYIYPIEE